MQRSDARLILLPGMGADARLLGPQRKAFSNLEVPDWATPLGGESLQSYGKRMAAGIHPRPSFSLGGVSFGGMVALEMSRHLPAEAVFLIGSCRHGEEIPWYVRGHERVLRPVSHLFGETILLGAASALMRFTRGIEPAQKSLLIQMLRETSLDFVRWAARAAVEWQGPVVLPMPVYRIHGERDPLIPSKRVRADRLVQGAGHVLNLTHADEVNEFLLGHVNPFPA